MLPVSPASIPVYASGGDASDPWRSQASSPLLPLQCKLAIGSSTDPLEAEADAAADRVMRMAEPAGRLSHSAAEPMLRRTCACESSGQPCANCQKEEKEKKKLMRKTSGGVAPMEAPPVVHEVLRSPGQQLDAATRAFFEPRFQGSFEQVRIHDDARAASSARQVQARAYAVGHHLVFAEGQFRPHSLEGRRLIAHELSHVQQQGAQPVVRRQDEDERGVGNPNSVLDRAYAAADASRWEEVAGILKDSSQGEIVAWIYPFRNDPEKISYMYLGAIGNKSVGPNSNLAQVTRATHLDFKFKEEKHRGNWGSAAEYLNGFNHDDVMRRLKPLKTEEVRSLHDGAVQTVGADSGSAKFTTEELGNRAAKGDAAAAVAPSENAQPLSVEQRKQNCAQGQPENGMIFPLRMPKGLWRIDVAPISASRDGEYIVVHQPVNAVYANSYFRSETRTLPLDVFTGGIRLKPDQVVRVRLYDQEKDGAKVIRCVTGEQMLKISDATDTAVIVGIIDTSLLAASVFVPGGGAAATRFAAGQIAANELGDLAVQKAQVDAGIQDKVDWAGLAFDTILQLATLGFGGKLTKVVLGKFEVIPAAGKFARPVLAWAVQSALSGATFDFQTLAHVVFARVRGETKEIKYDELIEQLALEFVKGALFHTIMSAAAEHEGPPQGSAGSSASKEIEPPPHSVAKETGPPPQSAARVPKPPAAKPIRPPADTATAAKLQDTATPVPDTLVKPKTDVPIEHTSKTVADPAKQEPLSQETPVTNDQGAPSKPPGTDQTPGVKKPAQDLQAPQGKKPPLPERANKKTLSVDEIPWADDVGLAMIELDEAAANQQFDHWIKEDPQREVAIYKDPVSGEYIVVQGKEVSVGIKDVVTDPTMRRNWVPIEHFHPGTGSITRLASRADFRAMMHAENASGKAAPGPVSSRIRWTDARGTQHTTEYGYKPGEAQPYYIEFEDIDGRPTTKTFKEEPWKPGSDYEEFLADRGVAIRRAPSQGQGSESGSNEHPAPSEAGKSADTADQETPKAVDQPPQTTPKTPRKKNPPLDVKRQLTAAENLKAEENKRTGASHEYYSSAERINDLKKKLPALYEKFKAAPVPGSLVAEDRELLAMDDFEARVARLEQIRSSKKDLSGPELAYFDTREEFWKARADLNAANEGIDRATAGRVDADIKVPGAKQELARASQGVGDIIRKGEDGPNYAVVSGVNYDQILGETASKSIPEGTGLNTDHVVPVREIRDMVAASDLPRLYDKASPAVKEAIEREYRNLGDIRSNLKRMRADANQTMKSDRSWYDISYQQAAAYGYTKEMVDQQRQIESGQRQIIRGLIQDLEKVFAARIQ